MVFGGGLVLLIRRLCRAILLSMLDGVSMSTLIDDSPEPLSIFSFSQYMVHEKNRRHKGDGIKSVDVWNDGRYTISSTLSDHRVRKSGTIGGGCFLNPADIKTLSSHADTSCKDFCRISCKVL